MGSRTYPDSGKGDPRLGSHTLVPVPAPNTLSLTSASKWLDSTTQHDVHLHLCLPRWSASAPSRTFLLVLSDAGTGSGGAAQVLSPLREEAVIGIPDVL